MAILGAAASGTGHRDVASLASEVRLRLETELPPSLCYHDLAHTFDEVVPTTLLLAEAEGVDGVERERLHAAALLHDIGYTRATVDHEIVGAELAGEMLPRHGFDEGDVAAVARLILATKLGHRPQSLSEAVIADADLAVVGRRDFWHRHRALQREMAALGTSHDDATWTELQARFLQAHVFHTATARALGEQGKRENERRVSARLGRLARLGELRRERAG